MTTKKQKRHNTTNKTHSRQVAVESDGMYFLKLVLVFLLGTFWLKFEAPLSLGSFVLTGVPLGFLAGIIIVSRFEHFQIDRKIWYAMLIVVTLISYFLPAGIVF